MSDQTTMQMDQTTMQKLVSNSPPSSTHESTNKQDDHASATSVSERPKSTMSKRYYARSFDQDSDSSDDDKNSESTDAEKKNAELSDDNRNAESTEAEPSQPKKKKNIVRRALHSVAVSIAGGNIYAPPLR